MIARVFVSLRLILVAALLVAMGSVGFAHRSSVPEMDAELLAYLEAGGSLSDICGDLGEDGPGGAERCEACRLLSAFHLPPPAPCLIARAQWHHEPAAAAREIVPVSRVFDHCRPPRGSPVV